MCKTVSNVCPNMITGKCPVVLSTPILEQCEHYCGYMCTENDTMTTIGYNTFVKPHPEYTRFVTCNPCLDKGMTTSIDGTTYQGHPGIVVRAVREAMISHSNRVADRIANMNEA